MWLLGIVAPATVLRLLAGGIIPASILWRLLWRAAIHGLAAWPVISTSVLWGLL